MTTLSITPRPGDRYEIEVYGFKRVKLYASKVMTPHGVDEPRPGENIFVNFSIEKKSLPPAFLGKEIDNEIIRFMALYHKLDPIPRKNIIILTTQKRNTDIVFEAASILEKIAPDTFYMRKHKGKPALFITDKDVVEELVSVLGDRYSKTYPTWLVGSEFEKTFVEERLRGVMLPRKNAVEITSSAINNEVFAQMLINQGYYLNVRNIEHKFAKNRQLWYITLYPTTDEHVKFISLETGKTPEKRTKNVINGTPYHRVKSVSLLQNKQR